ncbi:FAD-dependent oxidoreductase [Dietzia psychralcaliphila]|uniref:FAD-dependent oxidoreductase n=1 Tax=Dietzia psychralcaliphila TaxID=139021 RepID=UPI001C1E67CC|nr:FAD-dependent oxidoreductase [Dietzia psychralcaliphila]
MHKVRIAVVGSGPAGLFAADELIRSDNVEIEVDVIDRLPTPYGLVRYGVAPDHPRIKSVIRGFEAILESPSVRFLGNVEYGRDVDLDWLHKHYTAVVFATGASSDRGLGIVGESLEGSIAASELVSFYSGHPDCNFVPEISGNAVAVIGAGNVTLDVARILSKSVDSLATTDMPDSVIDALRRSSVRTVHIVCRRGPEHAKFTTKELRELRDVDDVDVVIDPSDLACVDVEGLPRTAATNMKVFREIAEAPRHRDRKTVYIHFWSKPVAVTGDNRVTGLDIERTEFDSDGALVGTGRCEHLPVSMVIRSVGYRSDPLPGLPFDSVRGVIPNRQGRVVDTDGTARPLTYVSGWLKRGPSGVIGTNRMCSAETVGQVRDDLARVADHLSFSEAGAVDESLRSRGVSVIDYSGWQSINDAEIQRGVDAGKERVKIGDWQTLRSLGLART